MLVPWLLGQGCSASLGSLAYHRSLRTRIAKPQPKPKPLADPEVLVQDESSLAGHVGERAVRGTEDDASLAGEPMRMEVAKVTAQEEDGPEPQAVETSAPPSMAFPLCRYQDALH